MSRLDRFNNGLYKNLEEQATDTRVIRNEDEGRMTVKRRYNGVEANLELHGPRIEGSLLIGSDPKTGDVCFSIQTEYGWLSFDYKAVEFAQIVTRMLETSKKVTGK